jgi:hypothetical protein
MAEAQRTSAFRVITLHALVAAWSAGHAQAEGWVEPWSALRPAPIALEDAREPLAERVALARALGRYGPEPDAVAALLATLERDPLPALRDEILRALARRAPAAARAPLLARLRAKGPKPPELGLALAAVGDREVGSALIEALGQAETAALARAALLAMGARAAAALGDALSGPRAAEALSILAELGAEAAPSRAALEHALQHGLPALAVQAAGVLRGLADARSAKVLAARASTSAVDDPVARAALHALGTTATGAQAPLLARIHAGGDAARRALALRALSRAAPRQAAPLLAAGVRATEPELRIATRESVLSDTPDASFVPALLPLARAGDEAATSALARVPEGGGVAALLALARDDAESRARVARPIALALRRFGAELDAKHAERARALLAALPSGPRRTLLCALAGVRCANAGSIGAEAPADRAAVASALGLARDAKAAPEVLRALEREREPEVARRLCDAARALGARPDARTLDRLVRDPETAPEALALWAALERERPSRALRVALRRALDPRTTPCTRAAAARALGAQLAQGDVTAEVPLVALLDDPVPRLRLSAVHALRASATTRAARALTQQARIERDPLVRSALARGPATSDPRPAHALELRVRADEPTPRVLEVWLEDGRCLRQRTLPGGELVIADLPPGDADVRVVD